ncbi:MAG: hypothetical protein ACPG61_10225 [Paracoccaceae bacterium]
MTLPSFIQRRLARITAPFVPPPTMPVLVILRMHDNSIRPVKVDLPGDTTLDNLLRTAAVATIAQLDLSASHIEQVALPTTRSPRRLAPYLEALQ